MTTEIGDLRQGLHELERRVGSLEVNGVMMRADIRLSKDRDREIMGSIGELGSELRKHMVDEEREGRAVLRMLLVTMLSAMAGAATWAAPWVWRHLHIAM